MQEQRIRFLLEQYISGQLTEIGQQELSSILANPDYEASVKEELRQLLELSQATATGEVIGGAADEGAGDAPIDGPAPMHPILERVLSVDKTNGKSNKPEGKLPGLRPARIAIYRAAYWRWAAAAAVLLTAGSVGYYAFHTGQPALPKVAASRPAPVKNDIAPGSNRAVLTLAGGNQIVLTGAQNGLLGQQGNTKIIQLANGKLAYEAGNRNNAQPLAYNTITTPRGGQYQVTLPDGTKVWLNAASSLRFPAAFTGTDRTVQVTGEAYFEVARDKTKPFIVRAGETATRVLGTSFNIMAYGDEKSIRTTLLEGAVRMDKGGLNTVLKPGEQGAFDPQAGTISTKKVNVRAAVAWKDGYYYFDRTKTEDVMRQISRWYDVDIVYQGSIPQDEIVGKIPRTAYVSQVLHIMELIGLRFKIEGRKIIVLS